MNNQPKEFLVTKEGVLKLQKELEYLINVRRPEIIEQLVEARAQGDLSENADYDAVRNAQGQTESRIKEINNILNHVKIIKEKQTVTSTVRLGSKVIIKDYSDSKDYTYEIVGALESNPFENKISNESPLAKTILGQKAGVEIEVKGIRQPYKIKIIAVK